MSTVTIVPIRLPTSQLTTLFNAGFSGYLVPLQLDEPAMRSHLVDNDIDLGVSRMAIVSDPVGFALIARRGSEAWVGGMGSVPDHRRRGIGERTLVTALEAAARDGAETAALEVLEHNAPAIALYEKLGFTVTRRLLVCRPDDLDPPQADWRSITVDAAHAWITAHRRSREPWQRDDTSLDHIRNGSQPPRRLTALAVPGAGAIAAAAICVMETAGVRVLQMAASDRTAAAELLRAVRSSLGGPLRLVNFPEDGTVGAALTDMGIAPDTIQFEMQLNLATPPV
jgi:GNAT superfamily N-acetyltransferase